MRLSKKDAAARLGVSIKTLDSRMKTGLIQFEKQPDVIGNGWRGNARVWVFLPDPQPEPITAIPECQATGDRAPQVTPASRIAAVDDFAARYLAGEACDSIGNTHDSTRKSLLGPNDAEKLPEPRVDATSHMDAHLISDAGHTRVENVIDSDSYQELIHPGHMDRKKALYASCGVRPLSEQQQKQRADKIAIHAAFRWSR